MKVLLLVALAFFEAIVDAGQIVSSSSSHVITSSSSSSSSSGSIIFGPGGGNPFIFPFPNDIQNEHFNECELNGKYYAQGDHTLDGCEGFYCGPNGFVQFRRCQTQLSVPGATCDNGVPLYSTANYPQCCKKKYTCIIMT